MLSWFNKIKQLEQENKELKAMLNDPTSFLEGVMKRGIAWFDYSKLPMTGQQTYFADAQNMFNGETFNNELDHFITDLIKFNANESKNFEAVMNVRASIVALETFKQRLGAIKDPSKKSEPFDPFSII